MNANVSSLPIGVGLPSFVPGPGPADLAAFAREAEDLGFDSLWLPEHLLRPSWGHAHDWLEPITTLTYIAAKTSTIKLGTAVLVAPLRNPAILAKELATLQYLSEGRFVLGVGLGWYAPEFDAVGVPLAQRGSRADAVLEQLAQLLGGTRAELGPSIAPAPSVPVPIWVGGGAQYADPTSVERPVIAAKVLARIARAAGWISRTTASAAQIQHDLEQITSALHDEGRDTGAFTLAHKNYLHIVPGARRAESLDVQAELFADFAGPRSREYLTAVNLVGDVDDIVAATQRRIDAGINYLVLSGVTADIGQLAAIREHVVPHLTFGPTL